MVVSAERAQAACVALCEMIDDRLRNGTDQLIFDAKAMKDLSDILLWLSQLAKVDRELGDNL